ncbi:unnamed protein product, partial [Closterium sp. NIES-54]
PPPPPSPPSPSSMGTGGRGCEGVADVPQQQQLPPRLLLYLSLPHPVLGGGGELGGSGGGGRGSAATVGGGDLEHQPPPPPPPRPFLLSLSLSHPSRRLAAAKSATVTVRAETDDGEKRGSVTPMARMRETIGRTAR